jgi:anaerobic magnesium-protoporphyrin IX monomethyl ester cyclase
MNILLVYPRWDYPTFGELQEPLGILHVGAMLKRAGHSVRMVDLTVDPIEALDEALLSAEMVGLSSSTAMYGRACKVLDRIRATRPDVPVVLGGPHATIQASESLRRGFDAVALGEGEHTAVDLAAAIADGRPLWEVPSVVALKDGAPTAGPVRPFEPDLDSLPDADRTLIRYEEYFKQGLNHIGMMPTRGCPWNCLFCKPMQDRLFGRKVRGKSIPRIVAEMKWIVDHLGKRQFLFKDDTLVLGGVEWFKEFDAELRAQGIHGVGWSCQSRVDQIDRPLVEVMKSAGLEGIAFGVESGSQRVLDYYRKGIKPSQTIAAFDLCHEMGIGTHAFIMLGAPVETKDDLKSTVELVRRIKTESVSVSVTTPAPGTALYDDIVARGLFNLKENEDSDYLHNSRPIKLSALSIADLAEAERAILDLVPTAFFRDQLEERLRKLVAGAST